MRVTRCWGAATACLVLGLAAACTSDTPPAPLPTAAASTSASAPTSASASPTASPTPAPTTGTRRSPVRWTGPRSPGQAGQVQAAVQRYWSTVVRLAERPDPDDPGLEAVAVDPNLSTLVKLFTTNRASGVVQRGPILGTVATPTVRGSRADVITCLDQTFTRVYESGLVRPGSGGSVTPFQVELRRVGETWKVSRTSSRSGTCSIRR